MNGAEMILAERNKHIDRGFDEHHDDSINRGGQLARAAVCYAQPNNLYLFGTFWPWAKEWWRPGTTIRSLVKAGALIAAEIDRLQRLEEGKHG